MKKILSYLLVLCVFTACNKMHKMGMHSVSEGIIKSDTADRLNVKEKFFTASNGDLVSFFEKGGIWKGKVYEKPLPGFTSSTKVLSVYFSEGFTIGSILNSDSSHQSRLINIESTSQGKDIIYVGNIGLPGGGKWSHNLCSASGCKKYLLQCRCGWKCFEGTDGGTWGLNLIPIVGPLIVFGREIANAGASGESDWIQYCELHCTCVCKRHVVLCPKCYACPHCKAGCRQCCGCKERIKAKEEEERKERERAIALEESRQAEIERESSSYSYSSYYSSPSSSSASSSTSDFQKRAEAARRAAASSSSSTEANASGYVSGHTSSNSNSQVQR